MDRDHRLIHIVCLIFLGALFYFDKVSLACSPRERDGCAFTPRHPQKVDNKNGTVNTSTYTYNGVELIDFLGVVVTC